MKRLKYLFLATMFVVMASGYAQAIDWSPTGLLGTARRHHMATLLPNGKVLVAGGWACAGINSAEVYDTTTGIFSPTGSMSFSRAMSTGTLLPSGKVLVAGGNVGTAELYDPATGTFSPTGSMIAGTRWGHTATLLPNGKVLIAGGPGEGGGPILNSAELYDPATETFSPTGSMSFGRYLHTATLLPNGKILIAGGGGGTGVSPNWLFSAELYDPATGTFSPTGSMSIGRHSHTATLLPNGKVLVAGGINGGGSSGLNAAELYDPATGSFSATGSMGAARWSHTATLLQNGKVLIAGGSTNPYDSRLDSVELYDPTTGSFSPAESMGPPPRDQHTATLLQNGKVLVAGGVDLNDSCHSTNIAQLYLGSSSPGANATVVNFDSIDTSGGVVSGTRIADYLAGFGITYTVGPDTIPVIEGVPPWASTDTIPNVLGMPGGRVTTYTLYFSQPVKDLGFSRVGVNGASSMGSWTATAYSSTNAVLGSASEGLTIGTSPKRFDLGGSGIDHVMFSSDHMGFAGTHLKIDTLTFKSVPKPVANAGVNQTVHVGLPVSLDGSGSADPDGNVPLTYQWSFVSRPAGSATFLLDPTIVNPSFIPDMPGNYVLQLVVTNSKGVASSPATVTISTTNAPPIAAAGPDQSVILIGTIVRLDGTQSYDPDGDAITYAWTFSSRPAGSAANLVNVNRADPTFIPDVHGTYVVQLVVNDSWVSSPASSVTVSFENVKPVANAGTSISVPVGVVAFLVGTGSSDANGDPLTYSWSLASRPANSSAGISSSTSVVASIVPDLPGTYVAQLVVNDNLVDSDPSTVQIQAYATESAAIKSATEVQASISALPAVALKNANMKNTLNNKLNAAVASIDAGLYADALDQLKNDILGKMDGCATTGSPDKNDWIKTCQEQNQVYPLVQETIWIVEGLL